VAIVPIRGGAFYEANPQTRIFYVKPAHGELGAELNFEPAASAANNWIEETSYLMAGIGSGDMKKGFAFTFDLNHWRGIK
jgi:hypothetical protein